MFNMTHLEHGVIALVIQITVWLIFGLGFGMVTAWGAGAIAFAVFLGREIAQHEYKGGGPNEVSALYGLTNHWTTDSIIDAVVPFVVCLILPLTLLIL